MLNLAMFYMRVITSMPIRVREYKFLCTFRRSCLFSILLTVYRAAGYLQFESSYLLFLIATASRIELSRLLIKKYVPPFSVVYQHYEPEVQNPGGFIGSNVLIKCNIPSFVKEYVTVTSWLQEPNFNIYPSLEGGKFDIYIKY